MTVGTQKLAHWALISIDKRAAIHFKLLWIENEDRQASVNKTYRAHHDTTLQKLQILNSLRIIKKCKYSFKKNVQLTVRGRPTAAHKVSSDQHRCWIFHSHEPKQQVTLLSLLNFNLLHWRYQFTPFPNCKFKTKPRSRLLQLESDITQSLAVLKSQVENLIFYLNLTYCVTCMHNDWLKRTETCQMNCKWWSGGSYNTETLQRPWMCFWMSRSKGLCVSTADTESDSSCS